MGALRASQRALDFICDGPLADRRRLGGAASLASRDAPPALAGAPGGAAAAAPAGALAAAPAAPLAAASAAATALGR